MLKALQKTILFEKEISAWLARNFGTKLADPVLARTRGGGRSGVGVGVRGAECEGNRMPPEATTTLNSMIVAVLSQRNSVE